VREAVGRGLSAFGRFWWDFLVGDTPELFVAMLVLVGVAFGLRHERAAVVVVLPVLAAAALVGSAWRGRATRWRPSDDRGEDR
jgi:hypothetical protein